MVSSKASMLLTHAGAMDLPAHPTLRPGDVVETGVFMGGSGIMMANVMKDWDPCGRRYFGFDSFQGLPQPVK